jgi:hypothetical protein
MFTTLVVPPFLLLYWWFYGSRAELYIALLAYSVFMMTWWKGTHTLYMAVTAAVLWTASIGLIYPSLGVNAFHARILDEIRGKKVIFYDDVHPALQPMITGRSFHFEKDANRLTRECKGNPLVFSLDQDTKNLEDAFTQTGIQFEPFDSYRTLISLHKLFRAAEQAGTDWRQAFRDRTIDPLKSTINIYQISC